MDVVQSNIENLLKSRHESGLYRQRSIAIRKSVPGASFMTNDYLALSSNEALKKQYAQAFLDFDTGSGGSPLNGGRNEAHERLENRLSELTGSDAAILFNSGYQASLAILTVLGHLQISVLIDKAIHASIYDGLQLGKVSFNRFRHLDIDHLMSQLSAHKLVITEGMFSMSGLIPPLDKYSDLVEKNQCALMIDEAHSFGVLGDNGLGAFEHFQLHQHQVPLRMISFAKAGASMGAVVVGQRHWIDALIQFARPYMYSSTMSPALAQALYHTVNAIVSAKDQRRQLQYLSDYFNQKASESGLKWRYTTTPIKQLQLGCPQKALKCKALLVEKDVHVQVIRSPTVPSPESGIRITLNADHQLADIDYLFDVLNQVKVTLC